MFNYKKVQQLREKWNAQKNYTAAEFSMAREVINQLVFGHLEGRPTLIHPFDLFEILESTDSGEINYNAILGTTSINGKLYRATCWMPAKTKRFENMK